MSYVSCLSMDNIVVLSCFGHQQNWCGISLPNCCGWPKWSWFQRGWTEIFSVRATKNPKAFVDRFPAMWITWLFGNYLLDLLDCLLSSWNKWNLNVCSEKCLSYVFFLEIIKLPNVKGIIFHVLESFVIKPTPFRILYYFFSWLTCWFFFQRFQLLDL